MPIRKIGIRPWHSSKPRMRGLCAALFAIPDPQSKVENSQGGIAQLVERQLCKLEVRGSNPLASKLLYANSEARLSQRLSLFCDTRRTRQRIRETRRRNFGHMPRLKHYVPGEAFDFQKSELVQWLMNNENAFDLVFSALQSSGTIVFDSETGEWKGCDTP